MKRLFSIATVPSSFRKSNVVASLVAVESQQVRFVRSVANTDVIIKKDFKFLVEGEVVKVKAGYMRNFLYPNKIAIYATESNLKELNDSLSPEMKIAIQEKKRLLLKQKEQDKSLVRASEDEEGEQEEGEEIIEEEEVSEQTEETPKEK